MENGHTADVRQVRYVPALGAPFGVEVLSFERLRRMDGAGRRTESQRPDFHVLGLVASGTGGHVADFVRYPLRVGSVAWIRPGVVHRWSDVERVDGPLILFRHDFLPPEGSAARSAADVFGPACWQLSADVWPLALVAADHLRGEHAAAVASPGTASPPLLAHLLAALVLRVSPGSASASVNGAEGDRQVFLRYRAAVEEGFAERHDVAGYAAALGYDRRTLTRATRAATGLGAKELLDQRVLLEAKRLLGHTDLPVAGCARRLGFRDAANFTTFFRRRTGTTPSAWRTTGGG
ncbi:AraC family transcriptional regulator [Streptomyces sp. PTM05]|uniref:AraC family transcriptional regulator n=1 Tax=Streptantibioticus parmotrematis TaxID=2873249 RepID=A0ABS7QWN2_9ACTN|nr:AraC family transcriptional regulator [Streptantibioticus parmotrematis]MBY8887074.1 AraC family transcriptional regulator [Streptantibioticus parmotrematis]